MAPCLSGLRNTNLDGRFVRTAVRLSQCNQNKHTLPSTTTKTIQWLSPAMSDLENAFTMLAADADLADQRACPQDARINATQDKKSPRQSDHAPEIERDVADCPLPEPFNGASGTFLQSPDPDPSRAIVKLQPPSPRLPSSAASTAADTATHELQPPLRPTKPWHFCVARLREDVHKDDAIMPLTWQAFLTGLVDSMIYASAEVWVGFVTGDFVQLSMNLANFIIPHKPHEGLKMLLRGMAIVGFFLGSMVAGRVGKKFGWHSRGWLVLSSVMQCLLLWIAAGIQLSRPKLEQPNWHWWPPTIIMASMSMGMQSTTSQQLASPVRTNSPDHQTSDEVSNAPPSTTRFPRTRRSSH